MGRVHQISQLVQNSLFL